MKDTLTRQKIEKRLFSDGIAVLFYQIEIPGCEGAARFCAFWETTAQRLQQTLQTQGVDFGRQCLEEYLDAGGKRSRFACPRFFLRIAEVKEERQTHLTLHAMLQYRGACLWEREARSVWAVAQGVCLSMQFGKQKGSRF